MSLCRGDSVSSLSQPPAPRPSGSTQTSDGGLDTEQRPCSPRAQRVGGGSPSGPEGGLCGPRGSACGGLCAPAVLRREGRPGDSSHPAAHMPRPLWGWEFFKRPADEGGTEQWARTGTLGTGPLGGATGGCVHAVKQGHAAARPRTRGLTFLRGSTCVHEGALCAPKGAPATHPGGEPWRVHTELGLFPRQPSWDS